jgi:hypothetical protein
MEGEVKAEEIGAMESEKKKNTNYIHGALLELHPQRRWQLGGLIQTLFSTLAVTLMFFFLLLS